jgi:adenylate cyclase
MTVLSDKLAGNVSTILGATWNRRDGRVVPSTDDVALANGAVKLHATVLYADLAHSTRLARQFPNSVAAKIVRAFLSTMTQLVNQTGGTVRSFDGDRVMGVYVGERQNTRAVECALKMNHIVKKVLRPKAEAKFPSLKEKGFVIAHCTGVARSDVLVVRGGVRGHNDLVLVGAAPNLAAKLSDIRNPPWNTYITAAVYDKLADDGKLGGPNQRNMWTAVDRTVGDDKKRLYKSEWTWSL